MSLASRILSAASVPVTRSPQAPLPHRRRPWRFGAVVLAAAMALGACGSEREAPTAPQVTLLPPSLGIAASATADAITAGDTLLIRITNNSRSQLLYNACPYALDRQVNGRWEDTGRRALVLCTAALYQLAPLHVVVVDLGQLDGLAAGTYRVRFPVYLDDGNDAVRYELATAAFTFR